MKKVQRSALVMHSAENMYRLVNDVESYPGFLPWCAGAELLESSDTALEARVNVSRGGVSGSFVTRNTMRPGEHIEITLKDGPFTALTGIWTFKPLMEGACKVSLDLAFEMDSSLLKSAVGKVFEQVASTMVDAFCSRADEVYG
ncbi:type II toxin-antitoxin system RatA family toxin [Parendozoicomonas sp. Alg238-R29]|uniref:type II toxin-antitoxin system RatA family toxin n=1 Tax=Parendozoicomonas sp. Alg238-R29 TaxID=2993446 RepID=UPI00248D60D6|nr:type II toxin-antitoxin system RatA family toxin [Parendozoicomonas sp. Alg238-R29]